MNNVLGGRKDTVGSELLNGSIWKVINFCARPSHAGKGIAGLAGGGGAAGGIDVLADSFRRLGGTGHVRSASIVGHVAHLRNEIVNTSVGTSVATDDNKMLATSSTCTSLSLSALPLPQLFLNFLPSSNTGTAIQNVLDG